MPEQPEEPYAIGEPKTLESAREAERPSREVASERPSIRRIVFWVIVAVVVVGGVVLYFMHSDAVTPVLRTGN